MSKEVLVATVVHPERRFRISKAKFDEANEKAKTAGRDSPFIVQEEGCEGPPSYDGVSKADQRKEDNRQKKRQAQIDADAASDEAED